MNWFRLYNNVRHDVKVQALRPELFRFWINLLCMASDQDERGSIPSIDAVAVDLGMRRDHVERFISGLEDAKLLIRSSSEDYNEDLRSSSEASKTPLSDYKGAFIIHAWSSRQPRNDDISKRISGHRKRVSIDRESQLKHDLKRDTDGPCNVTDSDTEENRTTTNAGASASESISTPDLVQFHPPRKPTPGAGHDAAVKQARDSFGDDVADRVEREWADVESKIGGRWDFLAGAFVKLAADLKKPNAKTLDSPLGAAIYWAKIWATAGAMPSPPTPAVPPARKPEPVPGYMQPLPVTDEMRAAMERKYEIGRRRVMEQDAAKAAAAGTGG